MPKAGSGFMRAAGRASAAIHRGGGSGTWRMDSRDEFSGEITTMYRQMYRTGMRITRDSRGNFLDYSSSDRQLDRTLGRMQNLAERMARHVQEINPSAAEDYARMRQVWGKAVRVNSQDMREFRAGMEQGDQMLINPRGGRKDSEAMNRAEEFGWQTNQNTNVGVLLEANRMMNATRRAMWNSVGKSGGDVRQYEADLFNQLLDRYASVERGAWKRRNNK